MRLIDADALMETIDKKFQEHYGNTVYQFIHDFFKFVIKQIRKAPTIEAEPVVHGEWAKDGDWLICLNCESEINIKNSLGVENRKNFCPNCGAKMEVDNG